MSTRFVWKKYKVVSSTSLQETENFGTTGKLPWSSNIEISQNGYSFITVTVEEYFYEYEDQGYEYCKNSDGQIIHVTGGQVGGSSVAYTGNLLENVTTYHRGSLVGSESSANRTARPDNNQSRWNWYVYAGSDSIDPVSVSILDTPRAGKPVGVAVAPVANTYGGAISYAYEYSVDDGASWQAAQTTTATEIALTVPEGAETLQVRARASDNMGFTSADYVTSEAVAVKAAGGITVTIDGIERELDGLYTTIDGILRPIGTAAVIDGIQRDIF